MGCLHQSPSPEAPGRRGRTGRVRGNAWVEENSVSQTQRDWDSTHRTYRGSNQAKSQSWKGKRTQSHTLKPKAMWYWYLLAKGKTSFLQCSIIGYINQIPGQLSWPGLAGQHKIDSVWLWWYLCFISMSLAMFCLTDIYFFWFRLIFFLKKEHGR